MFYTYRFTKKKSNKQIRQSSSKIATSIHGATARFYGPHGSLCHAPGALLGFGAVVHGLTTPGGELPVVSGDQPLGAAIQSANVGWSWLVGRGWLDKVINKNHWNLRPFLFVKALNLHFFAVVRVVSLFEVILRLFRGKEETSQLREGLKPPSTKVMTFWWPWPRHFRRSLKSGMAKQLVVRLSQTV